VGRGCKGKGEKGQCHVFLLSPPLFFLEKKDAADQTRTSARGDNPLQFQHLDHYAMQCHGIHLNLPAFMEIRKKLRAPNIKFDTITKNRLKCGRTKIFACNE